MAKLSRAGMVVLLLAASLFLSWESPRADSSVFPAIPSGGVKDKTYDFELRRTLGRPMPAGADLNECLAAAHGIKEGDGGSWYRAWFALAKKVDQRAQGEMAQGT